MEKKEQVVFREKAKHSIRDIAFYIEQKGYPETAEKFVAQLLAFGNSLILFPNKYQVCRQPQLAKRDMRCAVFHTNYIFVYKTVKNTVVIYNVIHTKTNPVFHSV